MEHSNLTIPTDSEKPVVGYVINSGLSDRLADEITKIQTSLAEKFPEAIWVAPRNSLHITLMDWLAPLVDYGQDKDDLFQSIERKYTNTLKDILENQGPIKVTFDTIEVYPTAIIVKGHDDGSYQHIREQFLDRINLQPGTKPPAQIIHSTICRFLRPIDVEEVRPFVKDVSLTIPEEVIEFRLARESKIFMQRYDILRRFTLGHQNEPPNPLISHT